MTFTARTLFLIFIFALYYLVPLEFRDLWQPDETRYAEISREMLARGDWVVPHFFDLRYFEKPVAGYWINNIGQWIFGHNNFAVRIGSVFSITMTALLVYWLALRTGSTRKTALMAGVIFLTALLVYGIGSYAVLDPMITLWLTAAMCSYWLTVQAENRKQHVAAWLLLGFACGLGFMTKGFLALAVPVIAIIPWAVLQKRLKTVICYGPLAVLGALLISAPWVVAIALREPDYWHYFFWVEHIQRFAEDNAQHKAPFWYYLPILCLGALPWLALLPGALSSAWRVRKENSGQLYLLCWTVMPLLFFSIAKGKLPTYILPCFAPLAILMAEEATRRLRGGRITIFRVNAWCNLLFGLICTLAILLYLAPWGLAKHPVYGVQEEGKALLAAGAFLFWGWVGVFSLRHAERRWSLAGLCPLALALVVGFCLPGSVLNSKLPQGFIERIKPDISSSRYLLANHPGIASAVSWELSRSDIILYDQKGEVQYGLKYADAQDKFVAGGHFADWLEKHRKQGSVALVLLLSRDDNESQLQLPPPDVTYRQGRLLMLLYKSP
ncbi:MAG: Undecaprenyl phosphate-alpha-4-amino-4-deoxy-L-arabinose arabinosyl transferase [Candidatus Erwinia impunctatus]|nr:Undecaprenyl phosphate-alpha-4-amino-4-deoxy-L-arabinose arabinosyl transferase [Culicoides impunctatus]